MSILARIRAHGGDVIRDEWRFRFQAGRLTPDAVAWVMARWLDVCLEVWPRLDAFIERAAIREFCGGQPRAEAEREAYREIAGC